MIDKEANQSDVMNGNALTWETLFQAKTGTATSFAVLGGSAITNTSTPSGATLTGVEQLRARGVIDDVWPRAVAEPLHQQAASPGERGERGGSGIGHFNKSDNIHYVKLLRVDGRFGLLMIFVSGSGSKVGTSRIGSGSGGPVSSAATLMT